VKQQFPAPSQTFGGIALQFVPAATLVVVQVPRPPRAQATVTQGLTLTHMVCVQPHVPPAVQMFGSLSHGFPAPLPSQNHCVAQLPLQHARVRTGGPGIEPQTVPFATMLPPPQTVPQSSCHVMPDLQGSVLHDCPFFDTWQVAGLPHE
jgi:hypothetical protein